MCFTEPISHIVLYCIIIIMDHVPTVYYYNFHITTLDLFEVSKACANEYSLTQWNIFVQLDKMLTQDKKSEAKLQMGILILVAVARY